MISFGSPIELKAKGMVKNYILYMACFCSEDSLGDDRRAKFSLVYEMRASKLDGDDVTAFSLTRARAV